MNRDTININHLGTILKINKRICNSSWYKEKKKPGEAIAIAISDGRGEVELKIAASIWRMT